jgi:hypothetical protein
MTSCSGDDEPKTKFSDVTLTVGQTTIIKDAEKYTWVSSNDRIASIDGNILSALHVGTASLVSDNGSFKVVVKGSSQLYLEPCLEFGSTSSKVKTWMSNNISGALLGSEGSNSLIYENTDIAWLYYYGFENNKLNTSAVLVTYTYTEELATFLKERYIVVSVDSSDYTIGFVSPEMDLVVLLQPYYYNLSFASSTC